MGSDFTWVSFCCRFVCLFDCCCFLGKIAAVMTTSMFSSSKHDVHLRRKFAHHQIMTLERKRDYGKRSYFGRCLRLLSVSGLLACSMCDIWADMWRDLH